MRSDVKVGLICAFVLVLAVVGYFAWSGGSNTRADRSREVPSRQQQGLETAATNPAGSSAGKILNTTADADLLGGGGGGGFGPRISYGQGIPPASMPATAPAGGLLGGDVAGGLTTQPRGALGLGGPAATRPATPTGGLTGGTSGGLTGGTPGGLTGGTPGGLSGGIPDMPTFGGSSGFGAGLGTATIAPATTEYIVKKGDSLWSIAHANHITRAALAAANGIAADAQLKEKQKLKIPAATGTTTGPATSRPATRPASTRPATTRSSVSHGAASGTQPSVTSVKVKPGDNLRKIAKTVYGDESQWKKIYAANKAAIGEDPNNVVVGQTLKIP